MNWVCYNLFYINDNPDPTIGFGFQSVEMCFFGSNKKNRVLRWIESQNKKSLQIIFYIRNTSSNKNYKGVVLKSKMLNMGEKFKCKM
jgi:hypothetical protein